MKYLQSDSYRCLHATTFFQWYKSLKKKYKKHVWWGTCCIRVIKCFRSWAIYGNSQKYWYVRKRKTYLVENPDFTIRGGLRHSMAIVMEKYSLLLGVSTERGAKFLDFVYGWVQALLVASLHGGKESECCFRWQIFHFADTVSPPILMKGSFVSRTETATSSTLNHSITLTVVLHSVKGAMQWETQCFKKIAGRYTNIHTLGCHLSYCFWRLPPIASKAFWAAVARGSKWKNRIRNNILYLLYTAAMQINLFKPLPMKGHVGHFFQIFLFFPIFKWRKTKLL